MKKRIDTTIMAVLSLGLMLFIAVGIHLMHTQHVDNKAFLKLTIFLAAVVFLMIVAQVWDALKE